MKEKKEWKCSKIFFFPQPHRYSWLYSIMSFRERNKIQAEGGSGLIESIFYWRCASYTGGNITDFSPSLLSPLFQFCLKPDSWDVFWKLCAFHSLPSSSFPVSISAFLYSKVYRCLIVPNVNTVLLTSLTSLLHLNQPCCCSAAKLMKFIAFSKLKKKKKKMAGKALTSILLGMPAALFSLECKQRQLSHSHITCHPHIRWRKHFYQGARQAPPASWSSWTSTAADQKHLSTWHKNWAHSTITLACWHAEDEIAEAANTLLPSWKH